MHALVAEAMKKAAVVWIGAGEVGLAAGGGRDLPGTAAWCLPLGGALYVVSGGDEQPAPGLADGGTVTITARGDHGGRIATWRATVTRIEPGTPGWDAVVLTLASKRLNVAGTAEALAARWAQRSAIWCLEPLGDELSESPRAIA